MTPASLYLNALAKKVAKVYETLPNLRAAMVTGSAAKGLADYYSDIDMTMYYQPTLPSEASLTALRQQLGAGQRKWLIGKPEEGHFAEAFELDGIEIQIGHSTIKSWEASMQQVLSAEDVSSPAHKAMEGTLACQALYGLEYIARWKEQLRDYPDTLAEAVVKHHLRFFPSWGLEHQFIDRDARFWLYEVLLETSQHLLGVLAGLNKLYFTTFQFKRTRRFVAQMQIQPVDLVNRLEALFVLDPHQAMKASETLVQEVIELVESHMPQIPTEQVRKRLGWRQQRWTPNSDVVYLS